MDNNVRLVAANFKVKNVFFALPKDFSHSTEPHTYEVERVVCSWNDKSRTERGKKNSIVKEKVCPFTLLHTLSHLATEPFRLYLPFPSA